MSGAEGEVNNVDKIPAEQKGAFHSFLKSLASFSGDLSSLTCPAFLLAPVSLIEYSEYWCQSPELFTAITKSDDEMERMVAAVKWYISSLNASYSSRVPKGEWEKKPFNPVLGEQYFMTWGDVDGCGETHVTCEQVSHHPPITGFYIENKKAGMTLNGHTGQKTRFSGTSLICDQVGQSLITLHNRDGESYLLTSPSLTVNGIWYAGKLSSRRIEEKDESKEIFITLQHPTLSLRACHTFNLQRVSTQLLSTHHAAGYQEKRTTLNATSEETPAIQRNTRTRLRDSGVQSQRSRRTAAKHQRRSWTWQNARQHLCTLRIWRSKERWKHVGCGKKCQRQSAQAIPKQPGWKKARLKINNVWKGRNEKTMASSGNHNISPGSRTSLPCFLSSACSHLRPSQNTILPMQATGCTRSLGAIRV